MKVIIDSNNICHMAKYAMKGLSWQDYPTGVIYGFLRQVLSLAEKFETNQFVFAWDSRTNVRKEIYPDYKKKRKQVYGSFDEKYKTERVSDILFILENEELDEETRAYALDKYYDRVALYQFTVLRRKVLPNVGFQNIFMESGFESDDIIARICKRYSTTPFTIVSSDDDLLQLLTEYVQIYNPLKKKIITRSDFIKDKGIEPEQWSEVKAIAGCNSDNIKGIERVGEKTALNFLLGKVKTTNKTFWNIKNGNDVIDRNRLLVKLPFSSTPNLYLEENESFDTQHMIHVFEQYGMHSLSNGAWRKYFN